MASETRVERLSSLISAAAAVVGEVDLDQVLRRLVSEAREATGAHYAALGVLGPHGVLVEFIHQGLDEGEAEKIGSLPQGRGVLGTVVRERRTLVLENIADHPESYGFPDGHPQMTSFLGVPIKAGQTTFGNLYLTEKPGGFDEADVALVEALALIAGSAVNTARLRERLNAIAIVEDRDRIAKDLHDTMIQDLFAVGLSLQGLSERVDESASTILNQAVDRLDGAVETLRRYIYELKTSDNLRRGLDKQLEDLIERMSGAYPTDVNLDVSEIAIDPDPRITEEVIKMVTEALSNALRHASANEVRVKASSLSTGLFLQIDDDGIGFDPSSVERGMGLVNMEERVRRLGGEIEVSSKAGAGTRVAIRLRS